MLDYTLEDWRSRAGQISFRNKAFIDGKFVDAVSDKTFDSINPANGQVLAQVAECDAADVDLAVAAGRRAFEDGRWSRMAPGDRKAVLLKLADLIRANLEEMALLDSLDMGKLVTDAATIDAPGSAHFFQWYAEAIDKVYDEVAPTGPGDLALVSPRAFGCRRRGDPVELPLGHGHVESSSRVGGGKLGRVETSRAISLVRPAFGRTGR